MSRGRDLVTLLALTAIYFAAGKLGLSLAFVNENASAVWPPSGIALASFLILGFRAWPAIFAGAFLVNLTTSGLAWASAAIATGNTLEGIAGASFVTRLAGGRAAFEHAGNIVRFALLAGIAATTVSATCGVLVLTTAGLASPADAESIWVTWWLGDAVGALLVAPLLVLFAAPRTITWTVSRALEATLLAATLLLVSLAIFGDTPAGARNYPLAFVTVPVLLWAAFRFGARGASAAAATLSIVAVRGTLDGFGPFARGSPNESLLLLQSFMGVISVAMLAVAAEVSARRAREAEIRTLNDSLELRVASRTEEAMRLHMRLAEAQQVAHVGSWEWDVVANTLWWSDELYRIYGLARGEAVQYETFLSHVHADDREMIDRTVRQALGDGRPFALDHRIVRPDGTVRVLHAEGRVIADAEGRPIRMVGIGHDVTELKHAEDERAELIREQAARREAEEASRAKDQFLATLSHELRTPMNAALGWAHMLREMPRDLSRDHRAVDAIYRNLLVQARLVSDIMDVSRITLGTLPVENTPVDLTAVVDAAVEMVRESAAEKNVRIETRLDAAGVEMRGDARRLQQVIWNLLSNAVKFARDNGRIHVTVARQDGSVEIVVEDDGPGIDAAFLPHVFEKFRQADSSLTRQHGGLGLGLAIARHIVEMHGGTIAAANRRAGGAMFTVRLPIALTSPSAEAATLR